MEDIEHTFRALGAIGHHVCCLRTFDGRHASRMDLTDFAAVLRDSSMTPTLRNYVVKWSQAGCDAAAKSCGFGLSCLAPSFRTAPNTSRLYHFHFGACFSFCPFPCIIASYGAIYLCIQFFPLAAAFLISARVLSGWTGRERSGWLTIACLLPLEQHQAHLSSK